MPSIAKKIEDFANDMLLSVADQLTPREGPDSEGIPKVFQNYFSPFNSCSLVHAGFLR